MQRSPIEFMHFVTSNYHVLAAMCRDRISFQTDSEITAFIRSHVNDQTNPTRRITEMKRLGILTQSTGEWAPPPFLVRFIDSLHQRHVLATPEVVQAWVEKLQKLARELDRWLAARAQSTTGADDDQEARVLLHEIGDTLYIVSATIGDNIERIGIDVAEYRAAQDAGPMRLRLRRLVELFENYLTPIMRVLETGGSFRAVTQQISTQCSQISSRHGLISDQLADEARRLRHRVTWLRRTVIRQADEAIAEIAPLCHGATRESLISRGVNRALEAIRQNHWPVLDLRRHLPVVVDLDSSLAGDDAIETFMQEIFTVRQQLPPIVAPRVPRTMPQPWTPVSLHERLMNEQEVPDLMAWLMREPIAVESPDSTINLLYGLLTIDADHIAATGCVNTYIFDRIAVDSHQWSWRNAHGD